MTSADDHDRPQPVSAAYLAYRGYVGRVLLRCGVPEAEVDDLTHEVFVVLLRRIDEQRDPGALRAWLFQAARRVASNYRRSSSRTRARHAQLAEPVPEPGPEDEVAKVEAASFISRFIEDLDESSRRLFVLSEIEGLRGPEVARELALNTQTTYSRIYALRRRFDRAARREFGRPSSVRAFLAAGLLGRLLHRGLLPKIAIGLGAILLVVGGAWWPLRRGEPRPSTTSDGPSWGASDGAELRDESEAELAAMQRASATLSGRVVDPEDAGIEGAWVCAWAHAIDFSTAIAEPTCTRSEAGGRYRLAGVSPGALRLTAGAVGFAPGEVSPGAAVSIEPGERSGLDIVLSPGGARLSGVVEDLTGGPVEGARIVLRAGPGTFGADKLTFGAWGDRPPTIVETDGEGRFVASVHPGLSTWKATATGYAATRGDLTTPAEDVVIRLAPGGAIEGTVVDARTRAPLAGLRVVAWAQPHSLSDAAGTVTTDGEGRFRIEGLPPGRYKPTASARGALGLAETSIVLGLGETIEDLTIAVESVPSVEGTVRVAETGDACGGAIVGLQAEAIGRTEWLLTGSDGHAVFPAVLPGDYRAIVYCQGYRPAYPELVVGVDPSAELTWSVEPGVDLGGVVTRGGRPVQGVVVSIHSDEARPPMRRGIVTDAEGRFRLGGLAPATYAVGASLPGASTGAPESVVVGESGAELELELGEGGSIRGVIVDEHDQPVPGAVVRLADLGGAQTMRADDSGRFAFEGLPWNAYGLEAAVDVMERSRTAQRIELGPDSPAVQVRVELDTRSGAIVGRVVDGEGVPVPDALVGLGPPGTTGGPIQGVTLDPTATLSDTEGGFRLEGLALRKYSVVAVAPDGSSTHRVVVAAVEPEPIELVAPEAASLAGRVVSTEGAPPAVFEIRAVAASGYPVVELFANRDGSWSLDGLAPGLVRLSAATAVGHATIELGLEPGAHHNGIELDLGRRVDLGGQIVDLETGGPVPGFVVVAVAYDDGSRELARRADVAFTLAPADPRQITDAEGRFVVPSLTPGPVRLAALPKGFPESRPAIVTVVELPTEGELRLFAPPKRPDPRGRSGLRLDPGDDDRPWTIEAIAADGPADELGLEPGDELTTIDGHDVTGPYKYLVREMLEAAPGTPVRIGVARGVIVELTLAGP